MPVLHEKLDGTYCVRKDHRGVKTWQVDGRGVRWLRERGVVLPATARRRDVKFGSELFFEALRLGLIVQRWVAQRILARECSRCRAWFGPGETGAHRSGCPLLGCPAPTAPSRIARPRDASLESILGAADGT